MFSKLTVSLAVTMSLLIAESAMAQQQKQATKAPALTAKQKAEAKKAEEVRAAEAAAKKAEEEKALEAKRAEEAKAAADKAKAEDNSPVYGYIKSHFSASYHGEYYFTRRADLYLSAEHDQDPTTVPNEDDEKVQDLKIMHNPTIIYRPMTNWKLLATSEFKYTDADPDHAGSFTNRHYRSLVLLTRENVLTEKEHGIKMDIGIGRRIFDRNHGKMSSYGNSRVNASLSKKFGDKLSTSMLVQYLANDPAKGRIGNTTWKHSLELIPSFTWQITDKLSYFFNDDFILNTPWQHDTPKDFDISHEMNIGFVSYQWDDKNSSYFQFKYLHVSTRPFQSVSNPVGSAVINDWFEYYIGHTHSFTPKLSLTGEVGSRIFAGNDKQDFFAREVAYPEFALYLDYSL